MKNHTPPCSSGASIKFLWGKREGQEYFKGGRNEKKMLKRCTQSVQKFAILMLSCQSWANFNTFEMILGGQTGGQENIFFLGGGQMPTMPPVVRPLPL